MSTPKRKPGRPPTGKTPIQNLRVPKKRWAAIEHAAVAIGMNRSELINVLIAWYTREPGVRLPKRPDITPPCADNDPDTTGPQPTE